MNNKPGLLLGLICAAWAAQAVAWEARYNGTANSVDAVTAIAVDNMGNCFVTGGVMNLLTGIDICTIAYNSSGSVLWRQIYDMESETDIAMDIEVDALGNVYVVGGGRSATSQYDYLIIKYNSLGQQAYLTRLDSPQHGWDAAAALAVDASGNVYVTGYYGGDSAFLSGSFGTARLNSEGQLLWLASYDGPLPGYDGAYDMALDPWGNVVVTGRSIADTIFVDDYDYATVAYSPSGEELWAARYDGQGPVLAMIDQPEELCVDNFGYIYVTGIINGNWGTADTCDITTIKYDSGGNEEWVALFDGPAGSMDLAAAIAVDAGGNVYVTGTTTVIQDEETDYFIIKYNSSGQQVWVNYYAGISTAFCNNFARDMTLDQYGNIYVTGESYGPDPFLTGRDYDIATLKYAPDGQQQWVVRWVGPTGFEDGGSVIAVDSAGYVYVGGSSSGEGTSMDYITIRYDQDSLGIVESENPIPGEFRLFPVYPNPFNHTTTITYQLPVASHVSLRIYDTAGRLVADLVNGMRAAGVHQVTWDASGMPSGLYFCRLQAGGFSEVTKLMLLK